MAKQKSSKSDSSKRLVRLEYLRERKRKRKLNLGIFVTVVLAAVLFYITGLYGTSIAVLGDAIDTIAIAMKPGTGWPAKTNMATVLDSQPLTGGFVVLGETDLAVYSDHGNQLRRISHGFARPSISVGDTRFCLYSRTGSQLQIENRSRTLYTKNFEQPILTAEIGKDNSVGVLTRSARYKGELVVYDRTFSEVFHWYATEKEGTPYLMSFSSNPKRIAVGCLAPSGGVVGMNIQILDTTKQKPLSLIQLQNTKGYRMQWLTADTLLVITDQFCAVFDEKGNEKARYSYIGKSLKTADVKDKTIALLFKDGELLILNQKLEVNVQQNIAKADKVIADTDAVYVITENSIQGISSKGENLGTQVFEHEPYGVVNAQNKMVLYGSQVDLLRLILPPKETEKQNKTTNAANESE